MGDTAASGPSYSETFAAFLRQIRFEDVPAKGLAKLNDCIVDHLGCQLVGSTLPWTRLVYDYAREIAGAGDCTVVGTESRMCPPEAVLVNATFGHGCEFDDFGHAGSAVIPPALAVAEHVNATGREFLTAVAAGYEVFFRVYGAVSPQVLERGFHQQVVVGVFSSVAAASLLLRLSEEQMVHAFGIAGSHAGATVEYDQSGGEVKRFHAGLAARGGVQAAMLASRGLTGPRTIFEGKRGIFRTFVEYARDEALTSALGERWLFEERIAFKPYPTCSQIHSSIEAMTALIEEHRLRPEDISRIRVGIAEFALLHGGTIVEPTDVLSAQFSLAFSVALRLVFGRNDLELYLDERLWRDERILNIARRVVTYADPSATGARLNGSLMAVETTGGRTLEHYVQHRRGTLENPASPEELRGKFESLAKSVLPPARIEEVFRAVRSLEQSESLKPLTTLLRVPAKSHSRPAPIADSAVAMKV